MLRRPSAPATSTGDVLTRRGSSRAARRRTGLDVPVARTAGTAAHGVVPRMRRPRAASEPARSALETRIDRHLVRLHGVAPAARPGAIDDALARRDPDTTSFAAIRPVAADPAPARVAVPGDRPRTAAFPAVGGPLG